MCNIAVFAAIGNNNGQAPEVSTQAGEDTQDKSQVKQETPNEAVVHVNAGNGYITYGGAELDGKSGSFKAPYAKPLTLQASANEGYELESVTVTGGGQTKTFTGESITIPAGMVTNGLKVTLSTAKKESASKDNAATPIDGDKSNKAGESDQKEIDKEDEDKTDTDKANNLPEGPETKGNNNSGNTDSATTPEQNGEGPGADQNTENNGATVGEGDGGIRDAIIEGIGGFFGIRGDKNAEEAGVKAAEVKATYNVKVGDEKTFDGTENTGYRWWGWHDCGFTHEWTVSMDNASAVTLNGNGKSATVSFSKPGTYEIQHTYCNKTHSDNWHRETTETFVFNVTEPVAAAGITISGNGTVEQFSSTPLTATIEPADADGTVVWSSSDDDILTVDQYGNVTGVRQGTASVTASVDSVSASKQISVVATTTYNDKALVYYLFNPNGDVTSNDTNQWGPSYGTATVNVQNATWTGDKNCFDNVDQRVGSWPNGTNVIDRNSAAWNQIFENYQATIRSQFKDFNFTAEDVEEITLVPEKISRDNGTDPDLHLDCSVNIKCKSVAHVRYMLRNAGESEYKLFGSKNYIAGSETQPTDVRNEIIPATKKVNGVTYTFSGWYLDLNYTQPVSFPYKVDTSTTFYAKYVGGFKVAYNLDGGAWDTADPPSYFALEGSTQMVKSEPKREGYKFIRWTVEGLTGTETVSSGSTFTMPANNVTITAGWEQLYSYQVNYLEKDTDKVLATADTLYGELGEEVTAEVKSIDGYHHVSSVPEGGKLSLTKDENVINLYYERNTVSYTVNYYLNDTEDKVADSATLNAAWGTKVTAADLAKGKDIEGCTAVPEQDQTITLSGANDSINVYYYKNVMLKANSAEKTYNGEKQSVSGFKVFGYEDSGFTESLEGVTFAGIPSVGAEGTDVGKYLAKFDEKVKNIVDSSKKYIVVETENGELVITGQSIVPGDPSSVNVSDPQNIVYDGEKHKWSPELKRADGTALVEDKDYTVTYDTDDFVNVKTITVTIEGKGNYSGEIVKTYKITKRSVTLKSADLTKPYDGEALVNGKAPLAIKADWARGEGADYTFTGSQTLVGSSLNTFSYTLKSNTNPGNYEIKKTEGTLTVTNRDAKFEITVRANSASATYDGKEHKAEGFETLTFTVEGNTYTVSCLTTEDPAKTDAGSYTNNITGTAVVTDANGNDVTAQFAVKTENGSLEINKAKVTLKSADLNKVYDGEALVNGNEPLAIETGWAEGEGATYKFTGSQTEVGFSDNTFNYTLWDSTKADNYDIHTEYGILDITSGNPNLVVVKEVTNKNPDNRAYDLGDAIEYKVTVRNDGDVPLKNIVVNDTLVDSVDSTIDMLKAGESREFTYNYVVTVSEIVVGHVDNTATATGTAPDDKELKSDSTVTVNTVAANARLKVTKETTSKPVNQNGYVQGETIKYKVTVENVGNMPVGYIDIIDELRGVEPESGKVSGIQLAPGQTSDPVTYIYTVTAQDVTNAEVINTARATGKTWEGLELKVDPGSTQDPTYNPPAPTPTYENPSMVIAKTASITSGAKAGDTITYNVTVRNNGDCDLTNVSIVDPLTGDKWSIDKLAVNATQSFTTQPYTVTTDDMRVGQVVNTATGTADNPTGKPTNATPGTATTYIDKVNASWTIDKSVTSAPANGSFYKKGEAISYQIVVTNTGNVDLTDIELEDSLVNLGAQGSIDKLAPGESRTIAYDYKVTAADVSKGKVVNSVTGTATGPDPVKPGGDRDDVNTGEDDPKPTPTPSGDNTNPVAPGGGNGGNGGTGGNVVTPTTPVAPVTPGMTETPSGETPLDANETPLAPASADAHCWVHWWIVVFMLLTLVYGCAVLVRRNGNSRELQEQQDRLLRRDDGQAQR